MITVRVLLFGHYRDVLQSGETSVSLPDGTATVADAARLMSERDSRFSDLLQQTRVAVGAEFARPDTALQDGDEVAFLHPMSGG